MTVFPFSVGTGNTIIKAVEVLKSHGVPEENIIVLNLFSTPQGDFACIRSYIFLMHSVRYLRNIS